MKRRDWSAARAKVDAEGRCRLHDSHLGVVGACEGPVEAAHVTDRGRDANEIVDPIDIIPLCRFHHMRYDARRISILGALEYDEQAAAVAKLGIARALNRLTSGQSEIIDRPPR